MSERPTPEALRPPEQTASDTRARRVDALREKVAALFEGEHNRELRERIERSFLVPQWGPYHNEGMFMDSHLSLILRNIDDIAQGRFPTDLSPHTAEAMKRALSRDRTAVERYVFLHDISKADCLTLKFNSVEAARAAGLEDAQSADVPVTWDQYQALLRLDNDGQRALEGDEAAMGRWGEAHGLKAVSYYHPDTKHGDAGSQWLRDAGADVDATTLVAIERHEDAYQFQKIDAERYLMIYAQIDEAGRDFALLASYVDTAASLHKDGRPDLANLRALTASKEKAEVVPELLVELGADRTAVHEAVAAFLQNRKEKRDNPREPLLTLFKSVADQGQDATKVAKFLETLLFDKEEVRKEQLHELIERLRSECARASYSRERLAQGVAALVGDGFTQEDADALVELAMENPGAIGKTFGKKLGKRMGEVKAILEGAQE